MKAISSFLTLAIFLSGTVSYAFPEANINLTCVTEFPSTSYFVQQHGQLVDIRILHHGGTKYAPFHQGISTVEEIPTLGKKAQMIEKLGSEIKFQWMRSGCNADTALFFQCVGEGVDFEKNGIKVHPYALTVTDGETKTMWGRRKTKTIHLNFSVEGERYELPQEYEMRDCVEEL
jgi:hypothetical protein